MHVGHTISQHKFGFAWEPEGSLGGQSGWELRSYRATYWCSQTSLAWKGDAYLFSVLSKAEEEHGGDMWAVDGVLNRTDPVSVPCHNHVSWVPVWLGLVSSQMQSISNTGVWRS